MISGSIVALVTPMNPQGDIDWPALDALIEWHLEQGTHGVVAMGTTGESATLNVTEHCAVIKRCVEVINGRIPVIAGTGANSTSEAVHLTEQAKAMNVDACLLVVPYYNKPTSEGLFLHYQHIADNVAIPQILYNVPSRTITSLTADVIERLSKHDNIIGIKEASGNIDFGKEIIDRCADDFIVLSGDDGSFLDLMKQGGKGNISVSANVMPKAMSDICQLALDGNFASAQQHNQAIAALHEVMFCVSSPIPVKWALQQMGRIDSGIRLPLNPLEESLQPQVRTVLQNIGAI